MKPKIYRAGIIPYVYEDDELKMLFMRPSNPDFGGDVFQIAKGKYEEGENAEDAALREGSEELGLFSGNIKQLHALGTFLGRTEFFLAEIKDKDMFGDPHFETKEVQWMVPKQFYKEGRDLHKPVVKAAVRFLNKITEDNEQQLKEIEKVVDVISRRFSFDDFDLTSGQIAALSEQPYKVLKYHAKKDIRLLMFALKDGDTDKIVATVAGHFDDNNFFVIQDAWTEPSMRRRGLMTALYTTLHDRLQMSLASDIQQTKSIVQLWKKLPLPQKVFDRKTKQLLPRDQVPDNQLYDPNDPQRYRLVIEHKRYDCDRDFIGIPLIGIQTLYEHSKYTHQTNKGKFF